MRISRLLSAAAGLLLAVSANAQEPASIARPMSEHSILLPGSGRTAGMPIMAPVHSSASLEGVVIDSLVNAFSYYSGQQQPLVWDKASNLTVTIMRGSPAVEGDGNNIYIRTSSDRGRTWGPRIGPLHDPAGQSGRYPSIAISNPSNSTNLEDILIFYTFPILNGDGGTFAGFASGLVSAAGGSPLFTVTNAGYGSETYGSDSKPVIVDNGKKAVVVQNLTGDAFAVRVVDFDAATETAVVPPQFAGTNFRPGTAAGSRYSGTAGLDKDASENLYAGFVAFPADFTESTGLRPAVSKSTDDGATWSALEYSPENLIDDYAASLGYNQPDSAYMTYDVDFVVTGTDSYSFLATMVATDHNNDRVPTIQQLVEISRKNGTWSIQKVADVKPFLFLLDSDDSDTLSESQLALEAQMERTDDGNRLVVKYVDFFNYIVNGDFNGDGQQPDTTDLTTDILVTSRAVNGGSWSAPLNLTNDAFLDRLSWIPTTIPDNLVDVPLLTVQNAGDGSETNDSAIQIGAQRLLINNTQLVVASQFDASSTTGVRENAAVAASALRIFPNPASAEARASFSVPAAGTVAVRIHDVTGNAVFSMPAQQMSAGAHSVPFNTESLANGVYYYTVTFNGSTSSTMFTVVR